MRNETIATRLDNFYTMTQLRQLRIAFKLDGKVSCFTVNDKHVQAFFSRMKILSKLSLSLLSIAVLWGGWLHCLADGNGGKSLIFNCFPVLIRLLFRIPVCYFFEIARNVRLVKSKFLHLFQSYLFHRLLINYISKKYQVEL